MLSCSCCENACRTGAVNKYLLCGTFTTACCQNKRLCRKDRNTASAYRMYRKASVGVFVYFSNKCQGAVLNIAFVEFVLKTLCIFRSRKLFAEVMKSETVVNTLLENTAEPCLSFKKENLCSVIVCADCCRKSGRASADNKHIIVSRRHHFSPPSFTFVSP